MKRILDRTPSGGQRLLFASTDSAVDVLVRRYLANPVVHGVDDAASAERGVALRFGDRRRPIRLPLRARASIESPTSGPGRTVVFTVPSTGARQLTRQLVAVGVPAVEMHGNLTQGVRIRNLEAFSTGRATASVATESQPEACTSTTSSSSCMRIPRWSTRPTCTAPTDSVCRGSGVVLTLATEDQRVDVAKLGRQAGVSALITEHRRGHPIIRQLARPASSEPTAHGSAGRSTGLEATSAPSVARRGTHKSPAASYDRNRRAGARRSGR